MREVFARQPREARRETSRSFRGVPSGLLASKTSSASSPTAAYCKSLGVTVSRVMTDNGARYKAHDFRKACAELGLKYIRTKPYTPKTNGKAERFIQTTLPEWAYAQAYPSSDRRAQELPFWLHRYNRHRPHGGIESQPPISRLQQDQDDLLTLHRQASPLQNLDQPTGWTRSRPAETAFPQQQRSAPFRGRRAHACC